MGKFYQIPFELAHRKDLTSTDKIVLAAIVDRIGKNTQCWPGMRTIADDVGVDKSTVVIAIEHLEKTGDLIVKRTGKGKRNYYSLAENSVRKSRTVGKGGCTKNAYTGVRETLTEPYVKPVLNQTDQYNQTNSKTQKISFDSNRGEFIGISDAHRTKWGEAYPQVNLPHELLQVAQWLTEHPTRQGSIKSFGRFLANWFRRTQQNAEQNPVNTKPVDYSEQWFAAREPDVEETFDRKFKIGHYAEVVS